MGDGEDPGKGAALCRVEPGGRAPDLEQHLLGDLFGLGRVAQHGADQAVNRSGQPVVDRLERALVATGD
jgi:hypothetical protein